MAVVFAVGSQSSSTSPTTQRCSPSFVYTRFNVLYLTFQSINHFELFLRFTKNSILFHHTAFLLPKNTSSLYLCVTISEFSVLSVEPHTIPHQHHTALYYSFMSSNNVLQLYSAFSKTVLAILVPLPLPFLYTFWDKLV